MTQQHLTRDDLVALLRPQRESCAAIQSHIVNKVTSLGVQYRGGDVHFSRETVERRLRRDWAVRDLFPVGQVVDFNGVECVIVEHAHSREGLCPVVLLPRANEHGLPVAFDRHELRPRVAEAVAHLVREKARP